MPCASCTIASLKATSSGFPRTMSPNKSLAVPLNCSGIEQLPRSTGSIITFMGESNTHVLAATAAMHIKNRNSMGLNGETRAMSLRYRRQVVVHLTPPMTFDTPFSRMECIVCFEDTTPLVDACCTKKACETCWRAFLQTEQAIRRTADGDIGFKCISDECTKIVSVEVLRNTAVRDAVDTVIQGMVLVSDDASLKRPPVGTSLREFYLHHLGTFCPRCEARFVDNTGCCHITCPTPGCAAHFCMLCLEEHPRKTIYRHLEARHFGRAFVSRETIQAYKLRRIVQRIRHEVELRGLMDQPSVILRREFDDKPDELDPMLELGGIASFDLFDQDPEDADAFFKRLGPIAPTCKYKKLKPAVVQTLLAGPQTAAARAVLETFGGIEAREAFLNAIAVEGGEVAKAQQGRVLYPLFPHWAAYERGGVRGVAQAMTGDQPTHTPAAVVVPTASVAETSNKYRRSKRSAQTQASIKAFEAVGGNMGRVLASGMWPAVMPPLQGMSEFLERDKGVNGVAVIPPTSIRLVMAVCKALPDHRRPDTVVFVSQSLGYIVVMGAGRVLKALFPQTQVNSVALADMSANTGRRVSRIDPNLVHQVMREWQYDNDPLTFERVEATARSLLECTEVPLHFISAGTRRNLVLTGDKLVIISAFDVTNDSYMDLYGVEDAARVFYFYRQNNSNSWTTHSGDLRGRKEAHAYLLSKSTGLAPPGTTNVGAWADAVLREMEVGVTQVVHIMLVDVRDKDMRFDLYAHGYTGTLLSHWKNQRAQAGIMCAPLVPGHADMIAIKPPRVAKNAARIFRIVKKGRVVDVEGFQDVYDKVENAAQFFLDQSRA